MRYLFFSISDQKRHFRNDLQTCLESSASDSPDWLHSVRTFYKTCISGRHFIRGRQPPRPAFLRNNPGSLPSLSAGPAKEPAADAFINVSVKFFQYHWQERLPVFSRTSMKFVQSPAERGLTAQKSWHCWPQFASRRAKAFNPDASSRRFAERSRGSWAMPPPAPCLQRE